MANRIAFMWVSTLLTFAAWAQDLKIESAFPEFDTGTYHYADQVKISANDAVPLVLKSDIEKGTIVPIIGKQLAIAGNRYLLLGWSSQGGGMHTWHAWLVLVDQGKVSLQDRVEFSCQRAHFGMGIQENSAGDRIAIVPPKPDSLSLYEWELHIGGKTLEADGIQKLETTTLKSTEPKVNLYKSQEPVSKVIWIGIARSSFSISTAIASQ